MTQEQVATYAKAAEGTPLAKSYDLLTCLISSGLEQDLKKYCIMPVDNGSKFEGLVN